MPDNHTENQSQKKLQDFIDAIGAMSETLGLLYKNLMNQGFSHDDALKLTSDYMKTVFCGGDSH